MGYWVPYQRWKVADVSCLFAALVCIVNREPYRKSISIPPNMTVTLADEMTIIATVGSLSEGAKNYTSWAWLGVPTKSGVTNTVRFLKVPLAGFWPTISKDNKQAFGDEQLWSETGQFRASLEEEGLYRLLF